MIKFVDLNYSLVEKVKALGVEATCADYFLEANRTEKPVLMTASNPMFTMGGGLDALFKEKYPDLVRYKQTIGGGNERIGNICFTITVGPDLKANKGLVKQALTFGLENVCEHETLVFSGLGTAIGGLSEEDFISVLREITQ